MYTFQVERAEDIRREVEPLLQAHYSELAPYGEKYPLEVDMNKYRAADDTGMLNITTARHDGKLVGYAIYFVTPHLRYRGVVTADIDVLYLDKDHRKGMLGYRLIRESEKNVRNIGATHIVQKCKKYFDLSAFFTRLGYDELERVFIKEL